ncbi:MAG: anthranilate synthase component I [Alphaproteobacteria bacterium]
MATEPSFNEFAAAYEAKRPQIVWTRLIADLETPVSVMLKLGPERPNTFLLESVEGGAVRGRYSVIGLDPDLIWRARGNKAEIAEAGALDKFKPCEGGTLDSLRALLAKSRIDLPPGMPPMSAGLVGYLGYDTIRLIERLPHVNPDPLGFPDGLFIRPRIMLIFDAVKDEMLAVTSVRPEAGVTAKAAYARAEACLAEIVTKLDAPLPHQAKEPVEHPPIAETRSNTTPGEFFAMVAKAREYILAGDIFQVVLSQRFETPFKLPPFSLYRSLRRINPSPFLFYLNFEGFSVVGSSPEILVRLRDGEITIRPIAGTRPRGQTHAEDERIEGELLADPKERAEHLMLLDLGRNDVGRAAKIGTVKVTESFAVERYSHVMHIVSNVIGKLKEGEDAISALMGGFPAGTLTGAPKVRAMEIIDELEKDKRGIYGGGVGYFSAGGSMDTCIVLRTAIIKDGVMYVQAGAGIVADSEPDYEQRECINKARALVTAAIEAVRFAGEPKKGQ